MHDGSTGILNYAVPEAVWPSWVSGLCRIPAAVHDGSMGILNCAIQEEGHDGLMSIWTMQYKKQGMMASWVPGLCCT